MSASLLQVFEAYQKARVSFVTAVAEAATRPQNVDVMQHAGVMQLLRPLLLDNVPGIQQTAALALGRLASYSDDLAEAVVANDILPQLVYSLGEQNVRSEGARPCGGWLGRPPSAAGPSLLRPPIFFLQCSLSAPCRLRAHGCKRGHVQADAGNGARASVPGR